MLGEDYDLVSFDVFSLFTSIPVADSPFKLLLFGFQMLTQHKIEPPSSPVDVILTF